jgi:O-antigen/teichoic acid export membrane protein
VSQSERSVRDRLLRRTALVTVGTRAVTLVATLVLTPVLTRLVSVEQFGVLVTLTAATAALGIVDLGIANALISKIAVAGWQSPRTRGLLSAAIALLLAASLIGLALSAVLAWLLPWPRWLNAPSIQNVELRWAAFLALVGVALNVLTSLGQKVDLARQRGHHVAAYAAGAALAGPLAAVVAATLTSGLVPMIGAAVLVPPLVLAVQTTVVLSQLPASLRPRRQHITRGELRESLGSGGVFMGLAIVIAVSFEIDALIVSGVRGASAAAAFGIVVRLFGVLAGTVQGAVGQLWASFAEALARGDVEWVRATLKRWTLGAAAVTGTASLLLVFVGRAFISAWVGSGLAPSPGLLVTGALWFTYLAAITPLTMLLNGGQKQRVQLMAAIPMAVANVGLSLALTQRWGALGPLLGSLLAHALLNGGPMAVYTSRWLRRLESTTAPLPAGT